MKKKVVISVVALVMLVIIALFMPYSVKSYDDGGTVEIKTLACKIIKWNRFYEGDLCYNLTKFYWGKDKKKNIEIIWDEIVMNGPVDIDADIENGVSPHFDAKVLEVSESTILVEPLEGSSELSSSDKITVPKIADNMMISYNCFDEIKAGDIVNIVYDGEIMETYPAQINPVFAITIKEKCGET
ncbi:MAG: YobA family protein, partial [Clostridia bacterium]|nr:YobA family protein [Clostridia bacterium]